MTGGMLATALVLSGLFVILLICERWVPLRKPRQELARRLLVNLSISALAIGTAAALVEPAGATALQYVSNRGFGLLSWIELTAAARFVIGFLLLDLTFYYWHLANHKIAFLWRFHNVHHIDRDLDVSTAFRFHFGEVAMSAGFRSRRSSCSVSHPSTSRSTSSSFRRTRFFTTVTCACRSGSSDG
jgi:sterol desaturase/sphingolipid hydroxylase (fatty acid hydroxylase superfamily)